MLLLNMALLLMRLAVSAAVLLFNVACVLGAVVGAAMITQYLEFGVLSTSDRYGWYQTLTPATLRERFYRVYWGVTVVFVLGSAAWVYFSERSSSKMLYGTGFFLLWELLQLVLALLLSSWEDVFPKLPAQRLRPWVHSLATRLTTLKTAA